jgi:23S rRNA G2069 N7-methylase RlmK/C1962 C5-methylase RlmI
MKYVIEKNGKDMKLVYYSVNMVGLGVEPKNGVPGLTIKAKRVVLVDPELRDAYIKQRINKKIDKVIKFMLRILNDEDTTEGDVGMVLDEINKLKGIVIKKYKEYMKVSEYKALLTKLIIIEEEFKKNYNQKLYMNYMNGSIYEEKISEGRSR